MPIQVRKDRASNGACVPMFAVCCRKSKVVQLLLATGADLNSDCMQFMNGGTLENADTAVMVDWPHEAATKPTSVKETSLAKNQPPPLP